MQTMDSAPDATNLCGFVKARRATSSRISRTNTKPNRFPVSFAIPTDEFKTAHCVIMRAPKYSHPMRYSQVEKAARTITRQNFDALRAEIRRLNARLNKVEKKLEKMAKKVR
jgi:hypothetical protein